MSLLTYDLLKLNVIFGQNHILRIVGLGDVILPPTCLQLPHLITRKRLASKIGIFFKSSQLAHDKAGCISILQWYSVSKSPSAIIWPLWAIWFVIRVFIRRPPSLLPLRVRYSLSHLLSSSTMNFLMTVPVSYLFKSLKKNVVRFNKRFKETYTVILQLYSSFKKIKSRPQVPGH